MICHILCWHNLSFINTSKKSKQSHLNKPKINGPNKFLAPDWAKISMRNSPCIPNYVMPSDYINEVFVMNELEKTLPVRQVLQVYSSLFG